MLSEPDFSASVDAALAAPDFDESVDFVAFAASAGSVRPTQRADKANSTMVIRIFIRAPLLWFYDVAVIARSARKGGVYIRLEELRVL